MTRNQWVSVESVTAISGPLTRALISQQVYRSGGSGTVWVVDDAIAKLIVKAFYENVFKGSKNGSAMDCTKVAWAHAVKTKVPLEQRTVFIHIDINDPDSDTVCSSYLVLEIVLQKVQISYNSSEKSKPSNIIESSYEFSDACAAFNQRFQLDAMMDWPLVFFNEAVSCAALNKTAIYLGGVTLQRSIRVEICKQNIKLPSFKHGTTLTVVVVKTSSKAAFQKVHTTQRETRTGIEQNMSEGDMFGESKVVHGILIIVKRVRASYFESLKTYGYVHESDLRDVFDHEVEYNTEILFHRSLI
ncbi:uncharacterized protein HD556DRAFT_1305528 [Suillus plorans]|uniref:Uncharacterized protein n=1 Tax=Suillus plorans TaxID=116603 RepID=A0A9P7DNP2_9AGAM|nr:uncharacterized protein HD556DRAFT_1305528 [Suillus plorans]KAG1799295.1 hypothetical protein HD556DRAFT_1305528 [Suillus plorans]